MSTPRESFLCVNECEQPPFNICDGPPCFRKSTVVSSMTETASTPSPKATEAAAAVGAKEEQGTKAAAPPAPLDSQPTSSTASSPSEEGGGTGDNSKSSPGLSPSTWKPNAAAAEWTPSFGAPAAAPSPVVAVAMEAAAGGDAVGGAKEKDGEGSKVKLSQSRSTVPGGREWCASLSICAHYHRVVCACRCV